MWTFLERISCLIAVLTCVINVKYFITMLAFMVYVHAHKIMNIAIALTVLAPGTFPNNFEHLQLTLISLLARRDCLRSFALQLLFAFAPVVAFFLLA